MLIVFLGQSLMEDRMLQEEMWRRLPNWPTADSSMTYQGDSILRLDREGLSCQVSLSSTSG